MPSTAQHRKDEALRAIIIDRKNIEIVTNKFGYKTSLILKSFLENNERWKEFSNNISKTKRSLVHTVLSFMAPPKPKEKSRWLNLEEFVKWAENALLQAEEIMNEEAMNKYKNKVSWVKNFAEEMKEWRSMLNIINLLMKEVKQNGLGNNTLSTVSEQMINIELESTNLKKMKNKILNYIIEQSKDLNGIYLGTSDIIESIFGRYKNFSAKTPMKEVGKAVLTMPVFTSGIDPAEVKEAMETITEQKVKDWLKENIGESLFSKRLRFCQLRKKNKKVSQEIFENFQRCA
jgi:hypothetical protein